MSRLFGSLFRFFRDNNLSNVRQPLVGESGETAPVDSGQKIVLRRDDLVKRLLVDAHLGVKVFECHRAVSLKSSILFPFVDSFHAQYQRLHCLVESWIILLALESVRFFVTSFWDVIVPSVTVFFENG